MMVAGTFMTALDADRNGWISKDEASQRFAKWFAAWNSDHSDSLSDDELRAGIDKDLAPPFGGPGGPGPGGMRPSGDVLRPSEPPR
jgi:hypothetical protein